MAGFCIKCGAPLPDGVSFCQKCGYKIETPSTSQPTQTTPVQKKKKNMKLIAVILAIIIVVIVVILLVLLLAGGGDSFIGKWNVVEHSSQGELYTSNVWTFDNDGNMTMEIEGVWPVGSHTYDFNWRVENNRIYSSDSSSPFSTTSGCKYEFSDGGNTIKIYDSFDESKVNYTLTKTS